jgi:hypothetical protein
MKARLLFRRQDEPLRGGKPLQGAECCNAHGRLFGTAEEYSTYFERSMTVIAAGLDMKPKLFQHKMRAFDAEGAVGVGPCEVVAGRIVKFGVRMLAKFSKHFRIGLRGEISVWL